jgi:hypothetical protein
MGDQSIGRSLPIDDKAEHNRKTRTNMRSRRHYQISAQPCTTWRAIAASAGVLMYHYFNNYSINNTDSPADWGRKSVAMANVFEEHIMITLSSNFFVGPTLATESMKWKCYERWGSEGKTLGFFLRVDLQVDADVSKKRGLKWQGKCLITSALKMETVCFTET